MKRLSVHWFSPSTSRSGEQECTMKIQNCPKELSLEHCFTIQGAWGSARRKEYVLRHISLSRVQHHSPPELADSTLIGVFSWWRISRCFLRCSTPWLCEYVTPIKPAVSTINKLTSDSKLMASQGILCSYGCNLKHRKRDHNIKEKAVCYFTVILRIDKGKERFELLILYVLLFPCSLGPLVHRQNHNFFRKSLALNF